MSLKRSYFRRHVSIGRGNKFGAVRSNGFGSKLENAVYELLLIRERAQEIHDIRQQHSVDLSCGIRWKVDFSFIETATGDRIYAEAKGVESDRYRICLKLWRGGHGPGHLEIWKGHYRRPHLVEVIIPETKKEK